MMWQTVGMLLSVISNMLQDGWYVVVVGFSCHGRDGKVSIASENGFSDNLNLLREQEPEKTASDLPVPPRRHQLWKLVSTYFVMCGLLWMVWPCVIRKFWFPPSLYLITHHNHPKMFLSYSFYVIECKNAQDSNPKT